MARTAHLADKIGGILPLVAHVTAAVSCDGRRDFDKARRAAMREIVWRTDAAKALAQLGTVATVAAVAKHDFWANLRRDKRGAHWLISCCAVGAD